MEPWEEIEQTYRAPYIKELGERYIACLSKIASLREQPADTDALKTLCKHLHWMAGTSGTFGFDEITNLAQSADRQCKVAIESGAALTDQEIQRFESALRTIEAAGVRLNILMRVSSTE
jgi:chemotaxis protein histidine kinase CheA